MAVPGKPSWTAMVLALCVLLAMAVFQHDLRQGNKVIASKENNATLLQFSNRRAEEHRNFGSSASEPDYSMSLEDEISVQDESSRGSGPEQSDTDKLRLFSKKAEHPETPLDSLLITNGSLQWTEGLEMTILSMLTELQYPSSCAASRKLFVEMDVSGLCWNFQAFTRALLLGLKLNRTVIPVPRPESATEKWKTSTWLGCPDKRKSISCFLNVTSCSFDQLPAEYQKLESFHKVAWNYSLSFEDRLTSQIEPLKEEDIMFIEPLSGYTDDPEDVYPEGLFDLLASSGNLRIAGGGNPSDAEGKHKIFLLFAIVSRWLLRPSRQEPTLTILESLPLWETPVAVLQVRRTDKMTEDPYWLSHGHKYRELADYGSAVTDLENEVGLRFGGVFVLSDTQRAIDQLLNDRTGNGLREDLPILYDPGVNRSAIETYGHALIPSVEVKKDLQDHFVAELYTAASMADYAVGTISSNIFRFLGQCIAARKRVTQISAKGPAYWSLDIGVGSRSEDDAWDP